MTRGRAYGGAAARRAYGYGAARRAYGYALALALLLTAACTGGGPAPSGVPVSPGGPGDIIVASGRDVTGKGGVRQQLIDAWNARQDKEHTGVHARLVELPAPPTNSAASSSARSSRAARSTTSSTST